MCLIIFDKGDINIFLNRNERVNYHDKNKDTRKLVYN